MDLGKPKFYRLAWRTWKWTHEESQGNAGVGLGKWLSLPKGGQLSREWRLHPENIGKILDYFGTAIADLFASRKDNSIFHFCSKGRANSLLSMEAMSYQCPQGLL